MIWLQVDTMLIAAPGSEKWAENSIYILLISGRFPLYP
jgi:hypothetical protein